ncbi:MAG: D-tyrosyl-tRNA(Tyr) deacylase [Elusimicrobia bacterium GWA2_61_42]|nr:MAG: D-tyrosyl-tRNA(Tyr) deacylase [Elusimicrobia bacterium GWA2_61_42]OGR79782.1 MAG: D-tyrosyl-tRNA(Tyr) deacylase [Elusimicrobia bacterium GWC2_61_25]
MRALIQRVKRGGVRTAEAHDSIGAGLVVLLGVGEGDTAADADYLAEKTANLRIFSNAAGKFDHSLLETGGEALVISQFTLYADASKGRRPDFSGAAKPAEAAGLYNYFVKALREKGAPVRTGIFAADMEVEIINDGPVTIWLDSKGKQATV